MKSSAEIKAEIVRFARELAEKTGEISWEDHESPFAAVEAQAAELGDQIACEFATHRARMKTETPPPDVDCQCPDCGGLCEAKKVRKKQLQTIRGTIEISEPEHHCRKCRRSFFPSDEVARR